MTITNLNLSELVDGFSEMVDTIWVINLATGQLSIIRDSMTPELVNREFDYTKISHTYVQEYVYPADLEKWDAYLSLESLRAMAASGCRKNKFDMRFYNNRFGFEWHEAFVTILTDSSGQPDRAILTSRYVNNFRKAHIVETAVQTEYDYVVYIEADTNSYVMYTSNHESGTPVPPIASSNYEHEVAEFHRLYVPEEEREALTNHLSIQNVLSVLENSREYVIFCKVMENGVYRDKKLRFSYLDREKKILLLTRTDIMEVREEKRQKQLLQDALQVAKSANEAKSDFLSRMSHDIRTPMNAIIGMTAIAGMNLDDPARVSDCLKKITTSSKLLLSLINEVLDMSKIESGRIMLSSEEFDLGDLLQSIVSMVQTSVNQKQHDFQIHLHQIKHEKLVGDVQRIQQVLLNLLTNAIKYTPDGGKITLGVKEIMIPNKDYGMFEVTVTDNGIGIESNFIDRIFEPFERAEDAKIRNIQGTGLGMAISRNIAQMMNGNIHVESEYGKGSVFTFTMQVKLQEQDIFDSDRLRDLPVLVVDDDEISCESACRCIDEIGMKSEYVLSGEEAVEKVKQAHDEIRDFFAVIVDMIMPGIDGIETADRIRKYVGRDIPIIILSAYDFQPYETKARMVGIDGFISKPLMKSKLFYLMKTLVTKDELKKAPAATKNSPLGNFSGRRILVVEDNELNREIASVLLGDTGAFIEEAENGKIALEKIQVSAPGYYDLVFMDIQMPVMNGYDSTRAIRALNRPDLFRLPIIAMSANAFSEDIQMSLDIGMNGHVAKPIDLQKIRDVLEKWL